MAINLVKGQKIDLTKGNAGLSKIRVGLGWDAAKSKSTGLFGKIFGGQAGPNIDCDASVIMLDNQGHVNAKSDVVYFGHLTHASKAVVHMGDNLTGDGEGDDEQILIELKAIPENIDKLMFVVNIYDCVNRKQDFGMIGNAFIRIVDLSTNKELLRYNLTEDYSGYTALEVGEVYRHDGEWKFAATGNGTRDISLKNVVAKYQA